MRVDIKGSIVSNDDKWIYDYFEMESTAPKDVQNIINKANGEQLDVYINSGGGDIFAGSEIYAMLKDHKIVNIHITGLAASSASMVACAGKSDIAETAMMLVHNVSSYAGGDYHVMDKQSEVLQKANKAIAAAYVGKTGMSEKDALKMMDEETWLTAQEAVDKGLVDSIANQTVRLAAAYASPMLSQSVIEKIRNTVKNPQSQEADIFIQKKAQAELELLNLGGKL